MSTGNFLEITQSDLNKCFDDHENVVTSDDYIKDYGVDGVKYDGFIIKSIIAIDTGKTFKCPDENKKMRLIVKKENEVNSFIINSGNIECWNIELFNDTYIINGGDDEGSINGCNIILGDKYIRGPIIHPVIQGAIHACRIIDGGCIVNGFGNIGNINGCNIILNGSSIIVNGFNHNGKINKCVITLNGDSRICNSTFEHGEILNSYIFIREKAILQNFFYFNTKNLGDLYSTAKEFQPIESKAHKEIGHERPALHPALRPVDRIELIKFIIDHASDILQVDDRLNHVYDPSDLINYGTLIDNFIFVFDECQIINNFGDKFGTFNNIVLKFSNKCTIDEKLDDGKIVEGSDVFILGKLIIEVFNKHFSNLEAILRGLESSSLTVSFSNLESKIDNLETILSGLNISGITSQIEEFSKDINIFVEKIKILFSVLSPDKLINNVSSDSIQKLQLLLLLNNSNGNLISNTNRFLKK